MKAMRFTQPLFVHAVSAFWILHSALHVHDFCFATCSRISETIPEAAGVRYRPREVISPTDTESDGSVNCAAWNPSPHCRSGRHPDGRMPMATPAQTWWRMLINR